MYPTGIGEPRSITFEGIDNVAWAGFHPDGRHVFAVGSTAGRPTRLYLLPIYDGGPRLLWDEEIHLDRVVGLPISPDGDRLVLRRVSGEHLMFSCQTGVVEPIRGLATNEHAIRFDESGRSLYVASGTHLQQRVDWLDLESGKRSTWRALKPPDPTGIIFVGPPVVAEDGSRYAYSFLKQMSDLFVVEGLG
jgi:dipeptidyl aminopeptidase/acylaminoacyl peptidase